MIPICVKCCVAMRAKKNDFLVRDCKPNATVWRGDKYSCPECGHEIVTGFGQGYVPGDESSDVQEAMEFAYL